MPVTTISDLKTKMCELENRVAWARTVQKCGGTEVERDRATEELVTLLREHAIAAEEFRQAVGDRRKYERGTVRFVVTVLGIAGLVFLLVW